MQLLRVLKIREYHYCANDSVLYNLQYLTIFSCGTSSACYVWMEPSTQRRWREKSWYVYVVVIFRGQKRAWWQPLLVLLEWFWLTMRKVEMTLQLILMCSRLHISLTLMENVSLSTWILPSKFADLPFCFRTCIVFGLCDLYTSGLLWLALLVLRRYMEQSQLQLWLLSHLGDQVPLSHQSSRYCLKFFLENLFMFGNV